MSVHLSSFTMLKQATINYFTKGCRTISTTQVLLAEPPRKKRRVDPAVLRVRVERKIKKHEREISKLESEPRQPIPILEYQYTNSEIRDLKARPSRNMADLGISEAIFKGASRLWNFYRLEQSRMENRSLRRVERAQAAALEAIKQIDEKLYKSTVAVDEITLIPYISSHVRKETAPNPEYTPPDGYRKDVTKDWVM